DGVMTTSDTHRPVLRADAVPSRHDEERLLGVIPLEDLRRVMVVVGHVVEASTVGGVPADGGSADDSLVIDRASWRVWVRGVPVSLSYQEDPPPAHLVAAPGRVFSRQEPLDQVWTPGSPNTARSGDGARPRIRRALSQP